MNTKIKLTVGVANWAAVLLTLQEYDANAQPNFTFTYITVPGGITPGVFGINNAGTLVGNYNNESDPSILAGFSYQKGISTPLTLPAGISTFWQLSGINDAGTAVGGGFFEVDGLWHSFLRTRDGQIINLPDAVSSGPAPLNYMFAINNSGIVVGFAGPTAGTWATVRGYLLKDGQYTRLEIPGGIYGAALGINDHNQIVGWYADAADTHHGFVKTGNNYTTIDFPGAHDTNLVGINNRGQIVGTYNDASGTTHGFLLSDGVFTTVDYPGQANNILWSINDHGEIAGTYNGGNAAFLATIVPPKSGN